MSLEKLNEIQRQVDELRADLELAEAHKSVSTDIGSDPGVLAAAAALAQAIARAQGIDMPLQAAPGASLPVIEVPREFAQQGGVGISVVVAAPQ